MWKGHPEILTPDEIARRAGGRAHYNSIAQLRVRLRRIQVAQLRAQGPILVTVSFTYMRSEGDCVWQIPFEQATLGDRRFIGSKAVHRVMLIFQDLEASTQSASIRTGVNEMMTRFARTGFLGDCGTAAVQ
jgi:hypothetical protein